MSTPSEPEATQTGSQPGTTQGVVTRLSPATLLGNSEDHQPLHPAHPTVTPHTPAVPLGGEHRYQHPAQLAPSSAGSQGTDRPHPTCLTPIWLSPRPAALPRGPEPPRGKTSHKETKKSPCPCRELSGGEWEEPVGGRASPGHSSRTRGRGQLRAGAHAQGIPGTHSHVPACLCVPGMPTQCTREGRSCGQSQASPRCPKACLLGQRPPPGDPGLAAASSRLHRG